MRWQCYTYMYSGDVFMKRPGALTMLHVHVFRGRLYEATRCVGNATRTCIQGTSLCSDPVCWQCYTYMYSGDVLCSDPVFWQCYMYMYSGDVFMKRPGALAMLHVHVFRGRLLVATRCVGNATRTCIQGTFLCSDPVCWQCYTYMYSGDVFM